MLPDVRAHLVRARDAEIARAAERTRRMRESRGARTRRPRGRSDPAGV
jgi:hypothetical protein